MTVYHNCYLYRSSKDIIISTSSNPNSAKRFKASRLNYIYGYNQNLKAVRDEEGNYYYLANDCKEIQ